MIDHQYHITVADDVNILIQRCTEMLREGWLPLGGPFVTQQAGVSNIIGQAFARRVQRPGCKPRPKKEAK